MDRRRFLEAAGSAGIASAAGCLESDDSEPSASDPDTDHNSQDGSESGGISETGYNLNEPVAYIIRPYASISGFYVSRVPKINPEKDLAVSVREQRFDVEGAENDTVAGGDYITGIRKSEELFNDGDGLNSVEIDYKVIERINDYLEISPDGDAFGAYTRDIDPEDVSEEITTRVTDFYHAENKDERDQKLREIRGQYF